MTDIDLLDEASWLMEGVDDDWCLDGWLPWRTVGDLRRLLAMAQELGWVQKVLRNLMRAGRDPAGVCRFCDVPRSTMHDPNCPVELAIRATEPAYAAALAEPKP